MVDMGQSAARAFGAGDRDQHGERHGNLVDSVAKHGHVRRGGSDRSGRGTASACRPTPGSRRRLLRPALRVVRARWAPLHITRLMVRRPGHPGPSPDLVEPPGFREADGPGDARRCG